MQERKLHMPVKDDLGLRMKTFYEQIPKTKLMRRCPVLIRIDGKAFHTFTRGFKRPFDEILIKTMQETTKYLCENIQGCVLGYTQSDEITLVLVDYNKLTSSAWFDYEVQKICSIAASMATMAFNLTFAKNVNRFQSDFRFIEYPTHEEKRYLETLVLARNKGAMFDARCFNIPKEEVTNCIYWRQLDASRNSIQMLGQANFSHKELQNKSCNEIQDMLMTQKGINWNDLPAYQKRGSCVVKEEYYVYVDEHGMIEELDSDEFDMGLPGVSKRSRWIIDTDIPIFKGEGREYIDELVYVEEE